MGLGDEAVRIAGATRDARPGMYDNALLAGPEFVFLRYGTQGIAYFRLAANGRFSPRQREVYGIYLALYRSGLEAIRPHTAPREITREVAVKMDSILAAFPFTDSDMEAATREFADPCRDTNRNGLGYTIGMEIHDVPRGSEVVLPGR